MTTRRTHNCNLCHAFVHENNGMGVRWETKEKIAFTTPGQAETHICQVCFDGLELAIAEMREFQKKRDELAAANG